ncbi:stage 0 sporulation protein B (sporulation initiation phosphotransferase) [Evansella caseinilytica]|uniref:Stage 0 sporulation protein B (Sporulation initiation phosphotransferase) n=1 Tax=Evansella caseinilytica TaxID=1503961 RepID=A0A1H3K3C7_9BACI|nr:Spo0B C-terminal domain-containing protein [Evansella caseinilytica]SDY46707.1 stage 0 sporulation protein B (sporulation initiation phosphotransferase) [Evansella caseinilytica]
MTKDWDVVDVLRHNRHDWLNKLQLIKGNLDIGRIQKAESIIDEIIQQAKNESDLSNLTTNKLAERLLLFNWESHPYVLAFEALVGEKNWEEKEELILSFLDEVFFLFDEYAKSGEDNQLMLILKDMNGIEMDIDFQGTIMIVEKWKADIEKLLSDYHLYIDNVEWDEGGCFFSSSFDK